ERDLLVDVRLLRARRGTSIVKVVKAGVNSLTTAAPPDEQRAGPMRLAHLCCQRPHQPRGPHASPLPGFFLPPGPAILVPLFPHVAPTAPRLEHDARLLPDRRQLAPA